HDIQLALAALAEVTLKQHGDSWLRDVLIGPHGFIFARAASALATAVRANDAGDYAKARTSAHEAGRLFNAAGNLAGALRAKAEEVYSLHLLYDGNDCVRLLNGLIEQLESHSYEWLRAQMSLEESNCAGLIGQLGETQTALAHGTAHAYEHHYANLFLRG